MFISASVADQSQLIITRLDAIKKLISDSQPNNEINKHVMRLITEIALDQREKKIAPMLAETALTGLNEIKKGLDSTPSSSLKKD